MKAGFIGAGKVGFSLGKYFTLSGITVTGYYSRDIDHASEAAGFTGSRCYKNLKDLTEDSDTLFITVPDSAIVDIWEELRNLPIKNKNICHCSGSISSSAFFDAKDKGAFGYSVHPLYAFSDRYESYKGLQKAYFTVEGDPANLPAITGCIKSLGNNVVIIDKANKPLYHCAAAVVSNCMAALADISAEMLEKCGFDRDQAIKAMAPLITGNANSIANVGPVRALTGPVERNDASTVVSHLKILSEKFPESEDLYRHLTMRLIDIAETKHPDRDYTAMKNITQKCTASVSELPSGIKEKERKK